MPLHALFNHRVVFFTSPAARVLCEETNKPRAILEERDGLTVGQVYTHVRQRHEDPVVQHYLSLEFPSSPMSLQQIIAVSLLQMGYEAKGPRRKQRFYRPARKDEAEMNGGSETMRRRGNQ